MKKKSLIYILLLSGVTLVIATLLVFQIFLTKSNTWDFPAGQYRDGLARDTSNFSNTSKDYIDIKFKDDAFGKFKFKLGFGLIPFDYNASWNIDSTPFLSEIKDVSLEDKTVTVLFTGPESNPDIDEESEISLNCDYKDTYYTDETITRSGVTNFWQLVKPGNILIAFCSDDSCTSTGGFCKIIKSTDSTDK